MYKLVLSAINLRPLTPDPFTLSTENDLHIQVLGSFKPSNGLWVFIFLIYTIYNFFQEGGCFRQRCAFIMTYPLRALAFHPSHLPGWSSLSFSSLLLSYLVLVGFPSVCPFVCLSFLRSFSLRWFARRVFLPSLSALCSPHEITWTASGLQAWGRRDWWVWVQAGYTSWAGGPSTVHSPSDPFEGGPFHT